MENETQAASDCLPTRKAVGLKRHERSKPKSTHWSEVHGRTIFGVVAGLLILGLLLLTDSSTHRWALGIHTTGLNAFFKVVKNVGHTRFSLILMILCYVLGRIRNDARFRRISLLIPASVVLSGLIVIIAKPVFGRMELAGDKPVISSAPADGRGETLFARIDERWGRFPSGDSAVAFSNAGALAAEFPSLAPVFVIIASLAALGRVYIGVHMASDVFAGAWLGWIVAHWLARRFPRERARQEKDLAL